MKWRPLMRLLLPGHAGAKFGLSAAAIREILRTAGSYPALDFAGLHIHIGSQLSEARATGRAIDAARALMDEYPQLHALNIGGGFPVPYRKGDMLPTLEEFVAALRPHLHNFSPATPLMIEPGRFPRRRCRRPIDARAL